LRAASWCSAPSGGARYPESCVDQATAWWAKANGIAVVGAGDGLDANGFARYAIDLPK